MAPDSLREIWRLSWPVMASQMLLNIVGVVDIAMVGRLDAEAVAAVGYATQFVHLGQSLIMAVGFAAVALVAQAIGSGDPERARHSLVASLLVALTTATLLAGVVLAAPARLLAALGAEPDVIRLALPYLRLVVSASVVAAVGLTLEFGFRANRNARVPMIIAAVVTVVKIVGNLVLIFGAGPIPRLELVGAGLATLLSHGVGLAIFVTVVWRSDESSPLAFRARDLAGARRYVRDVVRLTLPGVGERLATTLALLVYFRILSEYGSVAIATYTVGVRLLAFTWIPGVAFGNTAAILVGRAVGAADGAGVRRAGWRTTGLALVVAAVLGGACTLVPRFLAGLFSRDMALVDTLVPFVIVLGLVQPALQSHFVLGGAHRGAGDALTPFLATLVANWGIRVPLAFVLASAFHAPLLWIWLVIFCDHLVRVVWLAWSFRSRVPGAARGVPPPAAIT